MRALGVVFVLAGLLLIGGAAFVHVKTSGLGVIPAEVLALERSLARPGLLALATVDVAGLRELGVLEEGDSDDGFARDLARAGIDPARDVSHATLALSVGEGVGEGSGDAASGGAQGVLALFGRFDPAEIEAALREDGNAILAEDPAHPEQLLLTRIDRDTCKESGPWALHLAPDRVLAADPASLPALLDGTAPRSEGALRDLSRFQDFRAGQLVSAAVFVPDELPDTGNPLVGMAAYGAKQQVEGFRALYAGAAPRLVPPGLTVDALLEGVAPGAAAAKAQAWQAWLDDKLGGAAEEIPTLATLHQALELRAEGNDLHASFRLAQGDLEQLQKLPGELGSLAFGGGGGFQLGGPADALQEERLEESPRRFQEQVSKAALAAYDPSVTFAEPVDATVGPVGVRIAAVRLTERPAVGERTEIEIDALATRIPNLGDAADRVSLRVTRVEGLDGEDLLAREHCGPDRNELPAPLSNHFGGDVLKGTKAVRLREDAAPDDVARVSGEVTLRLPTRTERVKLPAETGEVERAGARLVIRSVEGSSVSYEVSGASDAFLHLAATNAKGQVLASAGHSSMGSPGGKRAVSAMFAGEVGGIEAVFALEEEELRYAFQLEGAVPGTSGEMLANETPAANAGAVAVAGALKDWLARVAGPVGDAALKLTGGSPVEAATRAGPFAVRLDGIWTFGGLMPRLEVEAPEVPGLDGLSAVELRLHELHRMDGSVERGDWSEALRMSKGWGRADGLVGSAQVETGLEGRAEDVASLRGEVRVRLPVRVRTETLARVELGAGLGTPDLAVHLVELGRDRFVLRATRGAERLLGAQAYNGEGDPLWTTPGDVEKTDAGALELAFQAKGVPARIDLRVAEKLAEAAYPFTLETGDRKVASTR